MTTDLFGMPVAFPEGQEPARPICAVAILKSIEEDGTIAYRACATDGVSTIEAIGMFISAADDLRAARCAW